MVTELRPVTDEDAALLARWRAEPVSSPFDDFSAGAAGFEQDERLPPPYQIETMLVLDGDRRPIGTVQWHPVRYGPTRGSVAFNIGISLRPDARGRGAQAQALLGPVSVRPVSGPPSGSRRRRRLIPDANPVVD